LKVLAVDDNKEITDMLSVYFEAQGIDFSAINDGKEGLDAILTTDSNLILLDIAMPGFTGLDIINHLRKTNLTESKNIVVFTASSISDDLTENLKGAGVKGVLKKPLDIDELQNTVLKFNPD
jgi:CheY-like chemotaxis protein